MVFVPRLEGFLSIVGQSVCYLYRRHRGCVGVEGRQEGGGRTNEYDEVKIQVLRLMRIEVKDFTVNSICKFYMPILEKGGSRISHNYFFLTLSII